jgi:hypothetical protein
VKILFCVHRLALTPDARVNTDVDAYCAVLLRIFADLASNLDSPPAMVQHNDRNCLQLRTSTGGGTIARHVRTH